MPIRIGGMATGMDTDALVKQLMQAKRVPIDKMKQQKTQLEWQRNDYRDMNVLLAQLRDAANTIRFSGSITAKKATSNNDTAVTATANSGANAGTYTLKVFQNAKEAQTQSTTAVDSTTQVTNTATKLTVNGTDIDIKSGATMSDVVTAVNAKTGTTNVKAFYDAGTQKISFTNTKTGAASQVNLSVGAGNGDTAMITKMGFGTASVAVTGRDAKVQLGSDPAFITSSTNTISINNINFTLKQDAVDPGGATPVYTADVTVASDVDKVYDSIKTFVDTYNDVVDKINKKVGEQKNRDFLPLTDDQRAAMKESEITAWESKAKSGMLHNDSTLKGALDSFRTTLSKTNTSVASGAVNSLYDIGITTKGAGSYVNYMDNGKLYIDENKLKNAIAANPDQVAQMLTSAGNTPTNVKATTDDVGIAERLYRLADQTVTKLGKLAGSSSEIADTSTFGLKMRDFDRRISEENSKLADYEQQYYSQFARMESAMSKMQAQQSWLAQSFSSGS